DCPASCCGYSRAACDRTTRASGAIVESSWVRLAPLGRKTHGTDVRRSWETWHMAAIRCTVLGEQTASRSACSSQTRIRRGSKRAVHELLPTRSRSYIGSLEPGTQNPSRLLRLSSSNRGRHGV